MLSQSVYLFSAKVLGYGIRILLPAFLVRVLTKAEFGAYNQFFLIEIMISMIFQIGATQSQYFFIPRDMKNAGAYFLNSLILNAGILAVAYTLISGFRTEVSVFLGIPVLDSLFWPLAAHSMFMALNITAETYLVARKLFMRSAIFDISRQVLATVATLVAAYLTQDLKTIVLALVAARIFSFCGVMIYIHFRLHGFRAEHYFFGISEQVKYGVVVGLAGTLWTILMRMNELLVSKLYGVEIYAVYAAGCKQIPILQFFTHSVAAVALVRFAQLEKENDWQGIRALWDKILGSFYGFGLPVTAFSILVAHPLVTMIFTKGYANAVIIFQINSLAMLFYILNPTLILRAMDRNDISVKIHLALVVIMPFMLLAGMKLFGLVGIISANAIMLILGRVVNHAVLNRLSPIHLPYVASRSSIWAFYQDSWRKGRVWVGTLLER